MSAPSSPSTQLISPNTWDVHGEWDTHGDTDGDHSSVDTPLVSSGAARRTRSGLPSAGVAGSIFNLSNSMLGGGISLIALPAAAREAGLIGFTALIVLSAWCTQVSVQLLADAAVAAGGVEPAADYGKVSYNDNKNSNEEAGINDVQCM